jgi:hypothetical protein
MEKSTIASSSLTFFKTEKNNNREWFAEKDIFWHKTILLLCGPINTTMSNHDA